MTKQQELSPFTVWLHVVFCSFAFIISGCAPTTQKVAAENGFTEQHIKTSKFNLTTYQKINQPKSTLNVYIEGDGKVVANQYQVSTDPSPKSSTVMQLAALDPSPNVIYLARPCQYAPDDLQTVCNPKYWTTARYSSEIVAALKEALDKIKALHHANRINLIGFSGGAALAVLIARDRNDIASIRTVAGNLDLLSMQQYHNSDPLFESLDPLAYAEQVEHIPQLHFIGDKDKTVPLNVTQNFAKHAHLKPSQVHILKGVAHHDGWVKHWPQLLEYVP